MRFAKYHGLGNDYLVVEPAILSPERARRHAPTICHRHCGIGSDGILLGPFPSADGGFGLRIINPDGSEAEKSGNGLRIFARYLWDTGRVTTESFAIHTPGGTSTAVVDPARQLVRMTMGNASFQSEAVGLAGPAREVVGETLSAAGEEVRFVAVSVGNPHCVVLDRPVSPEEARRLGPHIERDPRFAGRTNVQLLQPLDEHNIRIEIWERGAGYTLASGSSASASACAATKLGLCKSPVTVHMPGGRLRVEIDAAFFVVQTGPASRVASGELAAELLAEGETGWQR